MTENGGLAILNGICKAYLTIIRGTPVMIQLLIIYYVVLASVTNKILVAVIAFGLKLSCICGRDCAFRNHVCRYRTV